MSAQRKEEGQARFRRGVALYREGDLSGALAELSRAYQVAPSFRILYNLAQISAEARDHAAALRYFSRYLKEGDDGIPAERRKEVGEEIEKLGDRVGRIDVRGAVRGAEVLLDEQWVGVPPLSEPLFANVGRHRVEVIWPSGERRGRVVDVAGGQTVSVQFAPPLPARREPGRPAASAPATIEPPPTPSLLALPAPVAAQQGGDRPDSRPASRWGPRIAWTVAGACAIGAAVTGLMVLRTSSDLRDRLNSFPVVPGEAEYFRTRQRHLALATDGLLIGTLVASTVALYLTY